MGDGNKHVAEGSTNRENGNVACQALRVLKLLQGAEALRGSANEQPNSDLKLHLASKEVFHTMLQMTQPIRKRSSAETIAGAQGPRAS